MGKILSLILSIILLIENLPAITTPKLVIDASKTLGEASTKATGFLYGLAEPGVPSENITDSLHISSVSQKVIGGLQHPTGDIDRVSSQLSSCDYQVVYLQDAYDSWYYCNEEISDLRKNNAYDWEKFIKESYFPIIKEKISQLETKAYKDKLVYCIYNECDNGVWFGNDPQNTGVGVYDEIGQANFFKAWKMTYDLVKSIAPDALIGGPGFCDYVTEKTTNFLSFVSENNCVPDIMIYHELSPWSAVDFETHVKDYRRIEKSCGISELPIIVTEYGAMEECGNPSSMIHYICAMEKTGVYGNVAFWRLANNLNDTSSDDNTPNSNWWLYRMYSQLHGSLLKTEVSSIKDRYTHDGDWRRSYKGISSINDAKDEIKIIAVGSKNKRGVEITSLNDTNLGNKIDIKIECVYYNGLNSPVYEPILLRQYTKTASGKLYFNIPAVDTDSVYFITLSKSDGTLKAYRNTNIPVRYEFEDGKLLGDAYTYDSAYATTGSQNGLVGGIEKAGDGVQIDVDIPESGTYNFDIVYGKHNDSGYAQGRDYAKANVSIDGKAQAIMLSNTIKSEYTNLYTMTFDLEKGKHTLQFTHGNGTYVLDSCIVSLKEEHENISVLFEGENGKDFYAVAPYDGYYEVETSAETTALIDKSEALLSSGTLVYLRRGLNKIECEAPVSLSISKTQDKTPFAMFTPYDLELSGGAALRSDKYGNTYIDEISSSGGKAQFKVNADCDGDYKVTVAYSNNSEGGAHSYNVDLIERYITVENGENRENVFFRNTFSKYNFKTVTFTLKLKKGENLITFSNDGSYKFNDGESFAPLIKSVSVYKVTK